MLQYTFFSFPILSFIYSLAQTTSFTLSGVWQKINEGSVCFGAKNDRYGAFNMTKSGRVQAMKLVHRNGSVRCTRNINPTYWGCVSLPTYPENTLMTIITKANREALLPSAEELKNSASCGNKKHIYFLEKTSQNSTELVFGNLSSFLTLLRNQELQIWYGQDWIDCSEDGNSGATCVDVFAWYI